jgi:hypothetical protein
MSNEKHPTAPSNGSRTNVDENAAEPIDPSKDQVRPTEPERAPSRRTVVRKIKKYLN